MVVPPPIHSNTLQIPLVLATDLDGTFAGGSEQDRAELQEILAATPGTTLIYVTGRSVPATRSLMAESNLPHPDVLIADVGTTIRYGPDLAPATALEREIAACWPGGAAVRERLAGLPGIVEQEIRSPYRISYCPAEAAHLASAALSPAEILALNNTRGAGTMDRLSYTSSSPQSREPRVSQHESHCEHRAAPPGESLARALEAVRHRLAGLPVDVIGSAGIYIDVLPRGINKGTTLRRVLRWRGYADDDVIVAGDSLNDLALFETGLAGVAVGNSEPELLARVAGREQVYLASGQGAAGIVEALIHFGRIAPAGAGGSPAGSLAMVTPGPNTPARRQTMSSDFVLVSHREPYEEVATAAGPRLERKTNGVFATLDPIMRQRHGVWIAWSEEEEGRPFAERIRVPDAAHPESYEIRRIALSPEEAESFYYDFTSSALWPVLFSLLDRARFTHAAWESYQRVNEAFATAVCEEAAPGATVWINDFHLMLAPRLIRERRPDLIQALFLHTTFPPPDIFGVLPWRNELLDGMLHLDLIGFHIPSYALNFANTAERFLGARPSSVVGTDLIATGPAVSISRYPLVLDYAGREIALGIYPVGVDVDFFGRQATLPETKEQSREIREQTGARTVILSAERLDYVKGALERLECFERYLAANPDRHGEISFIQIAVPTRTGMEEFQEMRRLTEEAVGRINGRFGTLGWQPVMHFYNSFSREELVAFYNAADIVWVTPLRDGLNLVAKEYIASRTDGEGVVILSEFAGAAAEIDGVVLTNPYSPDDMDSALADALAMPPAERRDRMRRLRARVLNHDVHAWSNAFLGDVGKMTRKLVAAGG